jgi:hypothetical protein
MSFLKKKRENLLWDIHKFQDDSAKLYTKYYKDSLTLRSKYILDSTYYHFKIDSLISLSYKTSVFLKNELKAHETLINVANKYKQGKDSAENKYSVFKDSTLNAIQRLNYNTGRLIEDKSQISDERKVLAGQLDLEPVHIKYWTDSVKILNNKIEKLEKQISGPR